MAEDNLPFIIYRHIKRALVTKGESLLRFMIFIDGKN